MKTKKFVLLSMLVAQAMVLFIVESLIPTPFLPPGAKLGLTNLVTVISLYIFTPKEALLVIVLRTLLSGILVTNPQTMIYSFAGALGSLISMIIVKKVLKDKVSPVGVSCTGAFFHNFGQITTASLMFGSYGFFYMLPLNTVIGTITGFFIGITSSYLIVHLNKILKTRGYSK